MSEEKQKQEVCTITGKPFFGFYSKASVSLGCSINIWETVDGKEVAVTAVYTDPEAQGYLCEDKICLGELRRFIRVEREDPFRIPDYKWTYKK